jgi:CBS domain-containing protein
MRPITAKDLMNPEILTVPEELPVSELARFLISNEITGAPVSGSDGQLVGVVSVVDIVRSETEEDDGPPPPGESNGEAETGEEELCVADIMTPAIYAVDEDAPVSDIARKMLQGHFHRVLVTRDGRPVGIVTTSDLLGLLLDE